MTVAAAAAGCQRGDQGEQAAEPAPEAGPAEPQADLERSGQPHYVPIARVEGYGNPQTGELWARTVPIARPDAPEGVGVQSHALASPGHCEVVDADDGDFDPSTHPTDAFEFYTVPEPGGCEDGNKDGEPDNNPAVCNDGMGGGVAFNAFDQTLCEARLPANADDRPTTNGAPDHGTIFTSNGVGCARQHIGNYTSRSYTRVLLDVDVFSGDVVTHAPYGWPFTPGDDQGALSALGAVPTPAEGRNRPFQDYGLWDFGPLGPGESTDMWIYFKNGDSTDFRWSGFLLGEVFEICGNGTDDDCDGVVDNGCSTVADGGACYANDDCVNGFCSGAVLVSGIGQGGGSLADDVAGVCTSSADCNPPLSAASVGTYTTTTVSEPSDYQVSACPGGSGPEVIYEFNAPLTGPFCIDTYGSSFDTQLSVLETCGLVSSQIACNDDFGGLQSKIEMTANAGQTYYIVVDGYGTTSYGNAVLNISSGECDNCGDYLCDVDEDCSSCPTDCGSCGDCALAIPITGAGTYTGDTTGAYDDYYYASCGYGYGEDVVYAFTPTVSGTVCANTFGSVVNTQLSVQSACPYGVELACNNDAGGTHSEVEFDTVAGTTYYVWVDGASGSGAYTLNLSDGACPTAHCGDAAACGGTAPSGCACDANCGADGDCCPDACSSCGFCADCTPALSAPSFGSYTGDTTYEINDWEPQTCPYHVDAPDVIYEFTYPNPDPGTICVDTLGSSYDSLIYVRSGTCEDPLAEVACREDTPAQSNVGPSQLQYDALPGETLYIVVDGYYTSYGPYVLNITEGSCCGSAIDLYGDGTACCGDGYIAFTGEECDDGNSVGGDGCSSTCQWECGNGVIDPGEQCDDGGRVGGDGCSAGCLVECTPTLGANMGPGVDGAAAASGAIEGYQYVAACDMNVARIEVFTANATPVTHELSLWSEGAGEPLAELTGSDGTIGPAMGWQGVDVAPFPLDRLSNYWVVWQPPAGVLGSRDTAGSLVSTATTADLVNWSPQPSTLAKFRLLPENVIDVAMGYAQGCARTASGRLYCWGDGVFGALGTGDYTQQNTPVPVSGGFTDWVDLQRGRYHMCGVRSGGQGYCWGYNSDGQVGDGTYSQRNVPTPLTGGYTDWQTIKGGTYHSCGIRSGMLFCWGYNYYGQLGDGTTTSGPSPRQIGAGMTWQHVATGSYHSCGLRTDGVAFCWGRNTSGQLGNGTTIDSLTPVQVGLYTDWEQIFTGYDTTCGIRGGRAYCWGYNGFGQIGMGTTGNQSLPTEVAGAFADWITIAPGSTYHTCGIRAGGRAFCWGYNPYGQLGTGDTLSYYAPAEVFGSYTDWTDISGGSYYTCGVRQGRAHCWGYDNRGQLGDGGYGDSQYVPVPVAGP